MTILLFFANKLGLINRLSAYIGSELIRKFKFDYIYKKYNKKQKHYCNKLNLKLSNMVNLGIGGVEWKKYNRGGKFNRLCLSSLYEKK